MTGLDSGEGSYYLFEETDISRWTQYDVLETMTWRMRVVGAKSEEEYSVQIWRESEELLQEAMFGMSPKGWGDGYWGQDTSSGLELGLKTLGTR